MNDFISSKNTTDSHSITFSVFISSYNYGRFLACAIDSVLAQTLQPIEIVVADDGSTDNTLEVVAGYGDRVTFESFNRAGIIAVRNSMLRNKKGSWVLNLDADDWIEPQFLERAAALIVGTGCPDNLAFVYADRVDFGAYSRHLVSPAFDPVRFRRKNYVPFDALFRCEIVSRFQFDPAFKEGWEDYDFLITLVKNNFVGIRLPDPPVHCRVHSSSRTSKTFDADKMQRLMRQITAKHTDFFSAEEAVAAVAYFAPQAVLRHRICEYVWAKQYFAAAWLFMKVLITYPSALFSRRVLHWLLRIPVEKDDTFE